MARIIAVCNQKGGVGKTTTVVNLGAALAESNERVLTVDLDPRADLSAHLGVETMDEGVTIYEGVFDDGVGVEEVILRVEEVGLDVAPANTNLAGADLLLSEMAPGERRAVLRTALAGVQKRYDFILIDTAPGLHLLTVCGLGAADEVLIPQQCSFLALHGLRQIAENIQQMREMKPDLRICGVLLTMQDRRTIHHREVIRMVREGFGDIVFETVIPSTIRFQEAPASGEPITKYAAKSEAAEAYRAVAREVIERG